MDSDNNLYTKVLNQAPLLAAGFGGLMTAINGRGEFDLFDMVIGIVLLVLVNHFKPNPSEENQTLYVIVKSLVWFLILAPFVNTIVLNIPYLEGKVFYTFELLDKTTYEAFRLGVGYEPHTYNWSKILLYSDLYFIDLIDICFAGCIYLVLRRKHRTVQDQIVSSEKKEEAKPNPN